MNQLLTTLCYRNRRRGNDLGVVSWPGS
ncbi:hypothetical protein RHECNPAF_2530093 [Rhizobium etli CNPAF512]|nr:hypothetical protein RHECNPAF_2530093 [Rhizobium etli CNPAF512]